MARTQEAIIDWRKILFAFVWDRYIEEGNFILTRSSFKTLSDNEFRELEAVIEEAYGDYKELKGF